MLLLSDEAACGEADKAILLPAALCNLHGERQYCPRHIPGKVTAIDHPLQLLPLRDYVQLSYGCSSRATF
jgi:hypothetical protein